MKWVWLERYVFVAAAMIGAISSGKQILDPSASRWWIILFCICVSGLIGLVLALIFHPRRDRQTEEGPTANNSVSPDTPPVPISFVHVQVVDARGPDSTLSWPLKIYIDLQNDSIDPIDIGPADWVATSQQAQLQLDRTEGIGWKFLVPGHHESRRVTVPGRTRFQIWWGINSAYEVADLQRKIASRQLGTLVVGGTIGGAPAETRFAV